MPLTGRLMPITEVPDPVFAEKMMGDGFAIEPTDGKVYSPVSGKVTNVFPTKHAATFETETGHEVLIHFGLDTVKLGGEGFESHIEQGQEVKAGDLILTVDLEKVKAKVPSVITPIVFPNLKENEIVEIVKIGDVEAGAKEAVVIKQI